MSETKYYEVPTEVNSPAALTETDVQKEMVRQMVQQNILIDLLVQAVEKLNKE
jgi:hypothetical protein